MIDQLMSDLMKFLIFFGAIFVVGAFVYIVVLSVLQVRQVRLLQEKVQTDADDKVRLATYVYLIIQLLIFVIAVLIL